MSDNAMDLIVYYSLLLSYFIFHYTRSMDEGHELKYSQREIPQPSLAQRKAFIYLIFIVKIKKKLYLEYMSVRSAVDFFFSI